MGLRCKKRQEMLKVITIPEYLYVNERAVFEFSKEIPKNWKVLDEGESVVFQYYYK